MNNDSWRSGDPIWSLGPLSVYPITMFLGLILSFLTVCYFWKRQKYSWEVLQVILIIAVPSGVLGARLWYAFFNPAAWSQFFVFAGLSIHGAVIFAILAVLPYVYSKRNLVDIRTVFGIIVPAVLIGQIIGRIGNFANHEIYGRVVSGPSLNWLDWIGIKSNMFIDGEYRAPLFLYEMFANIIAYTFLVWVLLYRNWVKPGVTGALYFVAYGLIRAIMEPLRDNRDIMTIPSTQFPISLLVAIIMAIGGLGLAFWWQFFTKPYPKVIDRFFETTKLKFVDNKGYELITPIKPRRKYLWFGPKQDTRPRFTFFGPQVPNHVRLWIPKGNSETWSKRKINANAKKTS